MATGRKRVEHSEQAKLVARVRAFYPGVLIAAIPNGGSRTALERVSMHAEGVLAGMPDLCVLEPSRGFCGLFIEMKTQTGVVAAAQRDVARRLNRGGYLCVTARSAADGWAVIEDYLKGREDEGRSVGGGTDAG